MPDVTDDSSSESPEEPEGTTEETAELESETEPEPESSDEEGKPGAVPYSRFKQVNDERKRFKEYADVARWYQDRIGSPEEVIEYLKYKESKASKKEEPKPAADIDIDPAQAERIRQAILKTVPEIKEIKEHVESSRTERKEAEEAMYDRAEMEVRRMADEHKIGGDEKFLATLGQLAMVKVFNDPKLAKLWAARDVTSIQTAFKRVVEEFVDPIRKNAAGKIALTKRKVAGLENVRPGSAGVSQRKDPLKGKGLTSEVHDQAWEGILQTRE